LSNTARPHNHAHTVTPHLEIIYLSTTASTTYFRIAWKITLST
jgi:hypothetical protein